MQWFYIYVCVFFYIIWEVLLVRSIWLFFCGFKLTRVQVDHGFELTRVRVDPGFELTRVRVDHGFELTWVHVDLGSSRLGFELTKGSSWPDTCIHSSFWPIILVYGNQYVLTSGAERFRHLSCLAFLCKSLCKQWDMWHCIDGVKPPDVKKPKTDGEKRD